MGYYTNNNSRASVEILEQPLPKFRFRYESESETRGSTAIPGASSTNANKTFTRIRVIGYTGKAVVLVSCVTDTQPYR